LTIRRWNWQRLAVLQLCAFDFLSLTIFLFFDCLQMFVTAARDDKFADLMHFMAAGVDPSLPDPKQGLVTPLHAACAYVAFTWLSFLYVLLLISMVFLNCAVRIVC
jgi:hypothetical protein